MKTPGTPALAILLLATTLSLTSCISSKRIDKHVALEYGNELPAVKKEKNIVVHSSLVSDAHNISKTSYKMNQLLPLLFYWKSKERYTTKLNPAIAVNNFANALNGAAGRPLQQKLNGQTLLLNVEQAPAGFAIDATGHMIWLIYAFSWEKVFIEPDFSDLVVTYNLEQTDGQMKTGRIVVKNPSEKKNFRFYQSWRSGISEELTDYNSMVATVTKSFVTSLMEEL